MRNEFARLETALDKLPTLTGNAGAVIAVNGSGAALEPVTTIDGLTLTGATLTAPAINGIVTTTGLTLPALTLGGTVTSNGQSFSGTIADLGTVTTMDLNGGTIDGTVIGGASAAAATVTTLAASGAVAFAGTALSGADLTINRGNTDDAVIALTDESTGYHHALIVKNDDSLYLGRSASNTSASLEQALTITLSTLGAQFAGALGVTGAATFNSTVTYGGAVNGVLNTFNSMFINIDADSNSTGEAFAIAKDRSGTSGGTVLFQVNENGTTTVNGSIDANAGTSATPAAIFESFGDNLTSDIAIFRRPDAAISARIQYDQTGVIRFGTTTGHPLELQTQGVTFLTANTSQHVTFAGNIIPNGGSALAGSIWGSGANMVVQMESGGFFVINKHDNSVSQLQIENDTGAAAFAGPVSIANASATNELTFTGTDFTNILSATTAGMQFGNTAAADLTLLTNNTTRLTIAAGGAVTIAGALSKGSGSFRIDHPLKPDTHQLVHSFTESPQADLLYSGTAELVNGAAEINLDKYHGMTEGTFVALNRNIRVFTTNESDWEPIKGYVIGNILYISCQDVTCSDSVSWLVIGERHDQHMMDTDWTDDRGRVIVEPKKGAA